jgi:hypothetical protein
MKLNEPQNIEQNFDELELVAEKAGELNDRVGKIENELGAQTKTLESAAMVLDAAIKGLGALKHQVLENDIGALQLALNDKTAHLAREIGRFESAVAEIDRRAEAGDEQLASSLRDIALGLRSSFDAKSAEIAEWSVRVEREIAAHSVALAAIPPVIKGADAKPFNPRGEWQAGMIANSLDVVSYNGSSYISNEDGNTDKPTRSTKYTTLAKRSGNGAGGATDFGSLTGTILPAQVVPGSATYAVGDVLYAGTTGALSKLGAGSSGQLLSTQGAGAAPRWVSATGGAGDVNGPASATDNAIVRFDGTGGKTVQNSAVTIADTTGDIAGASSVTAPASTALTLAGGSTGASLVLGSGSGASSLTGTGNVKVGFNAASGALATFGVSSGSATDGPFIQVRGKNEGTVEGWVSAITNSSNAAATSGVFQINQYDGTSFNEVLRTTKLRNLLIGTTTDITGTGGLHVAGTSTASTTTSGALRVGSNVGLSGNAGGASYFGGGLNTAAASTFTGDSTNAGKWTVTSDGPTVSYKASSAGGAVWNRFLNSAGTRRGYYGFASGSSADFTLLNEEAGSLTIGTGSAATALVLSAAGAATFAGAVSANGLLTVTGSGTETSVATAKVGASALGGIPRVNLINPANTANGKYGDLINTSASGNGALQFRFIDDAATIATPVFSVTGRQGATDSFVTAPGTGAHTFGTTNTVTMTAGALATTGAATFGGAVSLSTAGTTVSIKSGTNAAAGTVTLVAGNGTITSTAIDVNTVIVMSIKTKSGSFDHAPSVVVAAGSATIDGHNSDDSTYNWIALKVN